MFDGVVGNPPFIRYQYLNPESQFKAAKIFKILGLPFTKHTNAWVPFVLASMSALRPGGRFGMILPAEIINVMHAQSLRTFFGNECSRLLIIDPEEIWFEDTLQGAVILLAEKKLERSDHSFGLGIKRIVGRKFLNESAEVLFDSIPRMNGKTVIGKWTHALLTEAERELMAELEGHADIHRFKNIAGVDVGIVTGANKFFLVNDETVEKFGLQAYAHPMFGRSDHCRGVIYDEAQHLSNVDKGNPTNFIWLKDLDLESDPAIAAYLELGKEQKLPSRYKCSVRTPWYTVPSVLLYPDWLIEAGSQ
ncbi:hypothetical protein LP420_21745 [Massilia sp. B-10]|nr:hypothetical protein LP420_21745 [Massilia sp. B-10]